MSDFLTILDNHRDLLSERGYDEIGLGSPDEPGLFMKKLEHFFSDCIGKARHTNSKQDFFIEAYGFFDNDRDMLAFSFHYEFDPAKKDISIKSLSARMDGIKHTFFLPRNTYELPYASKVHRMLCTQKQLQAVDVTLPHPGIEKIMQEQYDFLKQFVNGEHPISHLPRDICDQLRSELKKIIEYPTSKVEKIDIDQYVHFNNYDFLKCSFQYEYDPKNASLELRSIIANKNDVEKCFSIDNYDTSFRADHIHKAMKVEERLKYAKEIANHIPVKTKGKKF